MGTYDPTFPTATSSSANYFAGHGQSVAPVLPPRQQFNTMISNVPPSSQLGSNFKNNMALLPSLSHRHVGKKTLVLDLDETLVHSSFTPVDRYDFHVQIQLENKFHQVYVAKRPGVDLFLEEMSKIYEVWTVCSLLSFFFCLSCFFAFLLSLFVAC